MITPAEALERILPAFAPTRLEQVALEQSRGLCLARPLEVAHDAPAFDNSAMDGYAVRFETVATASEQSPVRLPLVGESRAGGGIPEPLADGSAMRIFTGAPMPAGANAVVMQEDTTQLEGTVEIRLAPPEWHHVRRAGSDLSAGQPLLPSGHFINGGTIALLASQSIAAVHVHRRPHVTILSTGDELHELGSALPPGGIVNSNGPMLSALIEQTGARCSRVHAADSLDAVSAALEQALGESDLVITTGGVSVGDHDVVKEAFARVGVEMGFWKIALKPGKPVAFGQRDGTPVVGLPGNPASAFVTFEVFVRPGIRRLLGDALPFPLQQELPLLQSYRHKLGRMELVRARIDSEGLSLHSRQGSGGLGSLAWANALAVIPHDQEKLEVGTLVQAILLGSRGADGLF